MARRRAPSDPAGGNVANEDTGREDVAIVSAESQHHQNKEDPPVHAQKSQRVMSHAAAGISDIVNEGDETEFPMKQKRRGSIRNRDNNACEPHNAPEDADTGEKTPDRHVALPRKSPSTSPKRIKNANLETAIFYKWYDLEDKLPYYFYYDTEEDRFLINLLFYPAYLGRN